MDTTVHRAPKLPKPAKKMKAPKETKPVAYKDLRSLKIAKSRKALPRGLTVSFGAGEIIFKIPKQAEPVLKVGAENFVRDSLRAAGFKLA